MQTSSKIGVLMAQLGTPDAPTPQALKPYLKQFLSDTRVIDYNPFLWQLILRLIILNTRPRRSARLYQRIWLPEGSPLLVYSQQQAQALQTQLGDDYRVVLGMTYGKPSMREAIDQLLDEGIDRIVVLPMFPQFSSTTTASAFDAVYRAAAGRRCPVFLERKRWMPTLRFVPPYYQHPKYIQAMAQHLHEQTQTLEHAPDKYVITFHGIPNRYIKTGDPYRAHCEETARLLVQAMGWSEQDWLICFQSRFGPEEWLQPYTDATIEALPAQGIQRPLVFSPGFVTDCLETLDELGNEARESFEAGGGHGEHYTLAPCLNAHPSFIQVLTEIVQKESMGWLQAPFHALS
jgi:protoporphyrin/coproporphyrin ferrochelatase